jgi:transposase InsO family protein
VFAKHGVPRSIVSDRDPCFTSGTYRDLSDALQVQLRLSTAFHPQTDGQTERVNRVVEDCLRHYVNARQDNWVQFVPLVEFAINSAWHESVQNTPFFLNGGRNPRPPAYLGPEPKRSPVALDWASRAKEAWAQARLCLAAAQDRQKAYADRSRVDVRYAVGDQVWLSTKHLKLRTTGVRKLLPRFVGPFPILAEVGPVAYKLQLPPGWRVHPVFHVSLLKACKPGTRLGVQPPPEVVDGEVEYEVEAILTARTSHHRGRTLTHYLVKWVGYSDEWNTWEPERNLTNCASLLQEFRARELASPPAPAGRPRSRRTRA